MTGEGKKTRRERDAMKTTNTRKKERAEKKKKSCEKNEEKTVTTPIEKISEEKKKSQEIIAKKTAKTQIKDTAKEKKMSRKECKEDIKIKRKFQQEVEPWNLENATFLSMLVMNKSKFVCPNTYKQHQMNIFILSNV